MSQVKSLKEVVLRLAETFNDSHKRESSYFDFYDESLVIHGFPPNFQTDKEGFKQYIYSLWRAFPDIRITFEDIIIDGNKVAGRYYLNGTHKGEFLDVRPTDRQFKVNGMTRVKYDLRKSRLDPNCKQYGSPTHWDLAIST
jgi:predicted ester cyclase